jgi:hypothetical protein
MGSRLPPCCLMIPTRRQCRHAWPPICADPLGPSDDCPYICRGFPFARVSSEKNDMDVPETGSHVPETGSQLLKCVWTSHPDHELHCATRIPAGVVDAAWKEELELNRRREGFFHFPWRGDVWLAYGLADGRVRGVYCPAHRAERDARSLTLDRPELALSA